jgi:hypothetical protein
MSAAAQPDAAGATRVAQRGGASPALPVRVSTSDAVVDVWSRTERKYRVRAIALLVVNLVLFGGLCVFTHWLHVARAFDFSLQSYAGPLRVTGADTQNLNDFVLFPISVVQTPIHAVVLGLLVAAILAVPIIIAILYRFPCALPFVACVGVLAHLPWMALTLLGSCVLASVRPFRMRFRYGSALVGMLPALLYLYLATRGTTDQLGMYASPAQTSLLSAPWALAILAACSMMAIVLLVSRMVNYRPEAVSPIVAFMFLAPVILFHHQVGADELYYRLLESQYGPRSARFEPVLDATDAIQAIMRDVDAPVMRYHIQRVWGGSIAEAKHAVYGRLLLDFLRTRAEAFDACKYFQSDHPNSRYLVCVLYIQGRTLDTRLDERRLMSATPTRELYSDFPHVQSRAPWTALVQQFPHSPLAIVAGLRLAQLDLRAGDVSGAAARLDVIARQFAHALGAEATTQPTATGILRAESPESSLEFEPRPFLLEAQRLRERIAANRDDPRWGNEPLCELARLDPHRMSYEEQLLRLLERFPDAILTDNVLVLWANCLADPREREAVLAYVCERLPPGDAVPEALVRLAVLELQTTAGSDEARRERGMARLRQVIEHHPESSWAVEAREQLRSAAPLIAQAGGRP